MKPDSKALQTEADVRAVLDTPQGRRLLWEILSWAGLFQTTADVTNPHATFFHEGRRSLGLQLLTHLEANAPGSLDQMRREANEVPRPPSVGRAQDAGSSADDTGPAPGGDTDAPSGWGAARPADDDFDPFPAGTGGGDR